MRKRVFSKRRRRRAFSVESAAELSHTVITGATGTAKSTTTIERIFEEAVRDERAIAVLDGHPNSLAAGVRDRFVMNDIPFLWDSLDSPVGLQWNFLRKGRTEEENELIVRSLADVTARRRTDFRLHDHPWIEDGLLFAFEVALYQREQIPIPLLHHVLEPKHPIHEWAVANCTEEEVRLKGYEIASLSTYQWEQKISPAHRMIKRVFQSPALKRRSGATFDHFRFLDNKGKLLVQGGSISKDATRVKLGALIILLLQYVRETGRPLLLVIDEAATFNLIGEHEVNALAELRKYGLTVIIIIQSLSFAPDVNEQILTNCGRKEIFRAGSKEMARLNAELLATYDPYLVHHVDERKKYAPDGFEEIEIDNEGWQVDEDGRQVWRGGRSKVFRPKHREEYEETVHYMGIEDQIKLLSREVMRLKVGERFVIDGKVWREQLPKPEREGFRCFGGYLDRKARKALNAMMQGPEFGTGETIVESWLRGCTQTRQRPSSSSDGGTTQASRPADEPSNNSPNRNGSDISDQF